MKKTAFFLAFLSLLLGCGLSVSAAHTTNGNPFESFREIPGVTDDEIRAVEQLQASKKPVIYGMVNSSEAFYWEDGTAGGFTALVCDYLSGLLDMEVVLRIYSWDELVRGMDDGTVALTSDLRATPERLKHYTMSRPIQYRVNKMIRLQGKESFSNPRLYNDGDTVPHILFLRGTTQYDQLAATMPISFIPVFAGNHDEALQMLRNGEADGLLTDDVDETVTVNAPDLVIEDFYPVIYEPVSLATADSRFAPVVQIIDKLLQTGEGQQLVQALASQGYADFQRHRLLSVLTEEEKSYMEAHKQSGAPVSVIMEAYNYPISFYNTAEGEYQGIAVDILNEIHALTGIVFEYRTDIVEWPQMLEALERGEADMLTELGYTPERKDRYAWTESAYATDQFALLSRAETPPASLTEIMGARVGVMDASLYMDAFLAWFPQHDNYSAYPSHHAVYDALESGEVDMIMATRRGLLNFTNFKELPDFHTNRMFDTIYESRFGINKNQQTLAGIVDKAQGLIDTEQITATWAGKVFDYRAKMYRMRAPYLVASSVLLVALLGVSILFLLRHRKVNRSLERLVKERTQELEVQTEAAQDASRAKSEFLARMSHEIRTPLNAVLGMTQVSRMSDEHSSRHRRQLDEILKASNHLLDILNDVLDMSKIEAGKMSLDIQPFRLFSALNEVVSIFTQRCEQKQLSFESNYPIVEPIWICADRLHLKQVLINLLSNAVKFTPESGRVQFLLKIVQESENAVTITFSVQDSGIGISEEQLPRLFNTFEQADRSISTRFGGSGLGLAVSQHLVGLMGGEISVESTPHVGSLFTFTVTFPKAEQLEELSEAGEKEPSDLDFAGKRLLLAEDIEINRIILMELLKDTHLLVDEAENGQQALELFTRSPCGYYDLVFMDVQMPQMNGYEATAAIRALPHPDAGCIPIIAMTANAYSEDIVKEKEAGMNDHVSKPIDFEIVARVLQKYLSE